MFSHLPFMALEGKSYYLHFRDEDDLMRRGWEGKVRELQSWQINSGSQNLNSIYYTIFLMC